MTAAAVAAVGVVWFCATLASDNAFKAEAEAACVDDVASKYSDGDADVFATLEGRDGDRLEFTAVDTRAEFHWTCFVTKSDGGLEVDSFK